MIECNRCDLQYIGETKRRLKDRFNEHRRTIDNPNNKSEPTTAAEHFLSSPNQTATAKITYQCKIIIVPEEGWFGQPKYSTPTKKILLRCVDFCFYFLYFIREAD